MDMSDRLLLLMLGGAIGFVLGYIVRSLREIKEEVEELVHIARERRPSARSEGGFMRRPLIADTIIFLVVLMSAYAAFATNKVNHQFQETQAQLTQTTECNRQYLTRVIKSLNQRTTYTVAQAQANVELQKAQATYIRSILQVPTPPPDQIVQALKLYFDSLTTFVGVTAKSSQKAKSNPFPDTGDLMDCVRAD